MKRFFYMIIILLSLQQGGLAVEDFQIKNVSIKINAQLAQPCVENIVGRLKNFYAKQYQVNDKTLQAIMNESKKAVQVAMEPYGYFSVSMNVKEQKIGDDRWRVIYDIQPGQRVYVSGMSVKIPQHVIDQANIKKEVAAILALDNQFYDGVKLKILKDKILVKLQQTGYPFATFDEAYMKFIAPNKIIIALSLSLSDRYHFGDIQIKHNEVLSSDFIKRYSQFKPGDPYDVVKVNDFQKSLTDSGYFDEVMVDPTTWNQRDHSVPVVVQLTHRKPRLTSYAMGYDDRYHIGGTVNYQIKPLNAAGHAFEAMLRLYSQRFIQAQTNYLIPSQDPLRQFYVLSGQILTQDLAEGKARNIRLSASSNWFLNHWRVIPSINALFEDSEPAGQPKYTTHLVFPELNIFYTLHEPTAWLKRLKLELSAMATTEFVLSDISMNKVILSGDTVFPLNRFMNFRLSGSVGNIASPTLDNVPLTLQFYAGGPYSLRGYTYNSIGPGRYTKNLSYELQFPITDLWGTLLFLDTGIASNHWSDKMKRGVGIGVSMDLKVVGLQVSIARPLDDRTEDFKIQFLVQSKS